MDTTAARQKWNRRYAEAAFEPFPDAPSEWLVEHRDLLLGAGAPDGGRALDVACGDGRNSRYLAGLGFAVDAVDLSNVAVDALRAAARSQGLRVCARVADLETTQALPEGGYDTIVNLNYLQRGLFPWLAAALRPGGVLVFETFTEDHVGESGHRLDPRFLLAPNELLHAFAKLHVRHYREGVAERSGRPRAVASLVAQRPAAG